MGPMSQRSRRVGKTSQHKGSVQERTVNPNPTFRLGNLKGNEPTCFWAKETVLPSLMAKIKEEAKT